MFFQWCHSELDNFTDSIILLEAADKTAASTLEKVMHVYRGNVSIDPVVSLTKHYIDGEDYVSYNRYSRYWHGYLTIMKPLLMFMTYENIRMLNGLIQLLLTLLVCILMYKRNLKSYIVPYMICYLVLMPVALAKSLHLSSCFYTFTIATIVLLLMNEKTRDRYGWLLFLNTGIVLAFFDFLSYPIATVGVPVVFCLILSESKTLEEKLIDIIRNGVSWALGYMGMWMSKWIIATLVTEENVIREALRLFAFRTSSLTETRTGKISLLTCEITNVFSFMNTPFILPAIAVFAHTYRKYVKNVQQRENTAAELLPFMLIAILPMVWYIFAANHSMTHYATTNKACVVTLLSLLCAVTQLRKNITSTAQSRT